jgi:hypothetical protein
MKKRKLLPLLCLILLLACAASTQFQPLLLASLGAVDGSFGIRPMSHACIGLQVDGARLAWLPAADTQFQLGYFSFRYRVDPSFLPQRPTCIGQDVWFGE